MNNISNTADENSIPQQQLDFYKVKIHPNKKENLT